jgi:50S ribosomal subunit-associated GTPase HflX
LLPANTNVLFCYNKTDLAGVPVLETADGRRQTAADFVVSALTGEGIESLLAEVIHRLIPRPPKPGDAVPLSTTIA